MKTRPLCPCLLVRFLSLSAASPSRASVAPLSTLASSASVSDPFSTRAVDSYKRRCVEFDGGEASLCLKILVACDYNSEEDKCDSLAMKLGMNEKEDKEQAGEQAEKNHRKGEWVNVLRKLDLFDWWGFDESGRVLIFSTYDPKSLLRKACKRLLFLAEEPNDTDHEFSLPHEISRMRARVVELEMKAGVSCLDVRMLPSDFFSPSIRMLRMGTRLRAACLLFVLAAVLLVLLPLLLLPPPPSFPHAGEHVQSDIRAEVTLRVREGGDEEASVG